MSEGSEINPADHIEDFVEKTETRTITEQTPATVTEQILFLLNIGISKAKEIWSKEDWQHKLLIVQFLLFIILTSVASLLWLRCKPALAKFAKFKSDRCLANFKLKSE